jgi:ABC-type transport system involved in multi-copper enzyme maturation permease subunit
MKRLLSIELQKIWKNRASKVLTITYFGLLLTIALVTSIKFDLGPFHIDPSEMGVFNFPFIWHFSTYIAASFKFFLAIVIVSMMANEYSYGTLKQNLIDGLSKEEFVLSKFLTVVLFAFVSSIFVFVMSLILGYSHSSYTEFAIVFSDLEYLLAFFVKLVGFFSICLFLGILVKKSAFAIGFLMFWYLLEKISFGLLKYQFFDKNQDLIDNIYSFFPLESMSNLIADPWRRLSIIKNAGDTAGFDMNYDYSVHFSTIIIVLCWTAIFIFTSYKILQKRDL